MSVKSLCALSLQSALLLAVTLSFTACTVPNPDYVERTKCPGKIMFIDDNKIVPGGQYTVVKHPQSAKPNLWAWKPLYKKNDSTYLGDFYTNHGYSPDKKLSTPPWLADAFELQLPYVDNANKRVNDFLKVTIPADDTVGLWVAYDLRAYYGSPSKSWHVPPWLKNQFDPTTMHIASTERQMKLPVELQGPKVYYGVWRLKNMANKLQSGVTLSLGGNDAPGASWAPGRGMGSQYLLLLVRKAKPGATPPARKIDDVWAIFQDGQQFTFTQADLDTALENELKNNWVGLKQNADYAAGYKNGLVTVSGKKCDCQDVTRGSGIKMRTCPVTSNGQALVNTGIVQSIGSLAASSSSASLAVDGEGSATIVLEGDIEFRVTEINQIEISELNMYGQSATLSGSGRPVTNLRIGHDAPFVATCASTVPGGPYQLCDQYEVPPGQFPASGFVTVDGHDFAARLTNPGPVIVSVNSTRTRFSIQTGQMQGSLDIDGTHYEVTANLNLEGPFDNLAPIAQVAELEEAYECGDQGVVDVTLYSSSFDESTPGDIVSTSWFEHAGTSTETLLSSGSSFTRTFGFGGHRIKLQVTDSQGATNSTDFMVNVIDSKIDLAEPPPDQWLQQQDRAGASSCLGQAQAGDLCSDLVTKIKTAPDCDHYSPGMTVVEWTFDDQNGNVETKEQRIFVTDGSFFPPPMSTVFTSSPFIATGQWFEIVHETISQGQGMVVDEYLLITAPNGQQASINGAGDIVSGVVEAHRLHWTVGGCNTSDLVYSGIFSDLLPDPGLYRIESRLVPAGGDPLDDGQVIAATAVNLVLEP